MVAYELVVAEVTSVIRRDVDTAAAALREVVTRELAFGWGPQGGSASVQAGTGVQLIQALVRR